MDADETGKPTFDDPLTLDEVLALRTTPTECAPTEFEPIDARIRGGGLPRGLLGCFTGPPEAGKTRLLCQIALGLSKTLPVVMLLSDWGRSAATDIMAVMEGFDPAKVDEDPRGVREWLKIRMGRGRLIFALGDADPLSAAFDFADSCGHCAILLDSAQTISPAGIPGIEKATGFEKNRLIARYMRARMRPRPNRPQAHTCLFTSESPRSFFAPKAKEDRTQEIASALGGGLEYAADFMIAMHRPEGEAEQRELVFAKNRYRPFLNRLPRSITVDYRPDGRLTEISKEEAAAVEKSAYEATLLPAKRVLRTVLQLGQQPSFRKFRSAVQVSDPSITDLVFAKVLNVMTAIDRSIIEGSGPRGATTYELAYGDSTVSE